MDMQILSGSRVVVIHVYRHVHFHAAQCVYRLYKSVQLYGKILLHINAICHFNLFFQLVETAEICGIKLLVTSAVVFHVGISRQLHYICFVFFFIIRCDHHCIRSVSAFIRSDKQYIIIRRIFRFYNRRNNLRHAVCHTVFHYNIAHRHSYQRKAGCAYYKTAHEHRYPRMAHGFRRCRCVHDFVRYIHGFVCL